MKEQEEKAICAKLFLCAEKSSTRESEKILQKVFRLSNS